MSLTFHKIAVILILIGFIFTGLFFFNTHPHTRFNCSDSEEKSQPDDWQFRQRAYPAGIIDTKAYLNAQEFKKKKEIENNSGHDRGHVDIPWKFCGPTNIGGRVTDIEMTSTDPQEIFVASASGGIFKSEDNGTTWIPIFDQQMELSIGDIAIAPSNENILYVGTGEPNAGGGSVAYDGNGVYKSEDSGNTWIHLGLDNIGSVGKVIIDPKNPSICFVGAMGHLFKNDKNRGVYKTNDGGITWNNVLFINDSTGVIDMVMDPEHPDTLYAAAWERVRTIDRQSYGGQSSGIYKSIDGGATWQELIDGLPGSAGRIGLGISKSNPNILYAYYTDETSGYLKGLFKSPNGGDYWTTLNSSEIEEAPYMWWYGKIFVDPINPDVVYVAGFYMQKSINGGNSWTQIFDGAHVDQHALCINPQNNKMILAGNDGGIYSSQNQGMTFVKLDGLPITQFYTCEVDHSFPERLYGGTQDNNPIRTISGQPDDWNSIYGGDGFRTLVDPVNNTYIYTEYQYGNFVRSEDGGFSFSPSTNGISFDDRLNWNTPFILDPTDSKILYYGSNRLYKSVDRALTWNVISPDLTQNLTNTNNVVFSTITTIDVSPIDHDIIYVGTDDGNVQLSTNGGSTWTLVSSSLPRRWVTSVHADPNNRNSAYVTLSGFRFGSDMAHIYKTNDLGNSWIDISGDLPDIPVNDLIVTPSYGYLYIATDVGIFYSIDQGANWELLGVGLPNVVITDLTYYAPGNFLVAASYGRGMFKISLDQIMSAVSDLANVIGLESSAYPNPFRSETTIKFSLEKRQFYSVSILNPSGVMVKNLCSQVLSQGMHEFSFDGTTLPNGLYLCSITTQPASVQGLLQLIKE